MSRNIFPVDFRKVRPSAVRSEGIYIYTDDGKCYLDGCCGAMASSLGHKVPEVIGSMKEQLDNITFAYRGQFTNPPMEELCTEIAELAPGDLNVVSLMNSGSEATEAAVLMAKEYWNKTGHPEKTKVISRWPSYHGATMGSLSLSGYTSRRRAYDAYLEECPRLELPFCHRCPYEKEYPGCGLLCARQLQRLINRLGSDTVSAVICEPVTGASGAGIAPPDDYFPLIREICTKNNILLIFDEVITGFGRTGAAFACRHWNVEPDIIAFAKGVSSGYGPMSGIIMSDRICDGIRENADKSFSLIGHTLNGNPLCAAGALAVVRYMKENKVFEGVPAKGAYLEKKLAELYDKYEIVTHYRGMGLLWGLELARDKKTLEPFPKALGVTQKMVDLCFENGLLVYPSQGFIDGVVGDSVLISPPLVVKEEEMDELIRRLDKSLADLQELLK